MQFDLIINNSENGNVIGQIKEYPAVTSQGSSIEELQENTQEMLKLYLEDLDGLLQQDSNISIETDIILNK